jgi:hypothetical protein
MDTSQISAAQEITHINVPDMKIWNGSAGLTQVRGWELGLSNPSPEGLLSRHRDHQGSGIVELIQEAAFCNRR